MKSEYRSLILMFVILIVVMCCQSCKVTKQIAKTDTGTKTESKSDSSAYVHNDIRKDSKIETEVTETIDTVVYILPDGAVVPWKADNARPVHIKKTKTTKTISDVKEVDKTKSKTDLNKREEKKVEIKSVDKDIKKTGIPFYWWIILAVLAACYLAWRFLLNR